MPWKPPDGAVALDWTPPAGAVAYEDLDPEQQLQVRKSAAVRDMAEASSLVPSIVREPFYGAARAGAELASTVTRPFSKAKADEFAELGGATASIAEGARKDDWFPAFSRTYGGASQSLFQAAAMAPAGLTGMAVGFGAVEGNKALYDAEQAGLKGNDRLKYAAVQGTIEATVMQVFNRLGLPGMEGLVGKIGTGTMKKFGKEFLVSSAQELPEELLTELGHAYAEAKWGVNPNAMDADQITQRMIDTAGQTLLTVGLAAGAAKVSQNKSVIEGLERIREKGFVTEEEGQQLGMTEEQMRNRSSRKAAVAERIQTLQKEIQDAEASATTEAAPFQGALDVGPTVSQVRANPLGDLVEVHPALEQGYGQLDVPTQRLVKPLVLDIMHDPEIFRAVVSAIPIDVMNDFLRQQGATESLLSDQAMFMDKLRAADDNPVTSRIIDEAVRLPALVRTEVPGLGHTRRAVEDLSARVTGDTVSSGERGAAPTTKSLRESVRLAGIGNEWVATPFAGERSRHPAIVPTDEGQVQPRKEGEHARPISKIKGEVREGNGGPDVRGPGQVEVPEEQAGEVAPARKEEVQQPDVTAEAPAELEIKRYKSIMGEPKEDIPRGAVAGSNLKPGDMLHGAFGDTGATIEWTDGPFRVASVTPRIDAKGQKTGEFTVKLENGQREVVGPDQTFDVSRPQKQPPRFKQDERLPEIKSNDYVREIPPRPGKVQEAKVTKLMGDKAEIAYDYGSHVQYDTVPISSLEHVQEQPTREAVRVDEDRVAELVAKRFKRSGNKEVDSRRKASIRQEVLEEAEAVQKYPPGTTVNIDGYRDPFEVKPDGTLVEISTGRRMGDNAGAVLRKYKPDQITVISETTTESPAEAVQEQPKPRGRTGRKDQPAAAETPVIEGTLSPEQTGEQKRKISGSEAPASPETQAEVPQEFDPKQVVRLIGPDGPVLGINQEDGSVVPVVPAKPKNASKWRAAKPTKSDVERVRKAVSKPPSEEAAVPKTKLAGAAVEAPPAETAAEQAQREAEEARPDIETLGMFGGGRFKGERVREDQIPEAMQAPEAQEKRLQAARGYRKPSLRQKVREALGHLKGVFRAQEHIPNTEEFASANEFFRLMKVTPNKVQDEAIRMTASIVDPLGPQQLALFERLTIMENMSASVKLGQPLRSGFESQEDVNAYRDQLRDIASRVPEAQKAIDTRKKIVREIVDKLVEYKLLPEAAKEHAETYYHQQVHFYAMAHGLRSGGRPGKKKRSFQKHRVLGEELADTEMDYNTSYIEAEASWMTDALHEIEKERLWRDLMGKYDIRSELVKQAEEGQSWQELVPEGYSIFQPEPGNVFYRAFTVPERIIEQLEANVIETAELSREDIRAVLALGGPKQQVVVPTELADQLFASKKGEAPHGLAALSDAAMKGWKVYTLLNPKRALAYFLRNMTGDVDPVVASDPSLLKPTGRALKELKNYHSGKLQLSEELRAARNLGVIDSGFVAEEVPDISDLPIFRRFMAKAGKKNALTPVKSYFDTVKKYNTFRENVLRYSAFLGYRAQLQQGRVKHYGGSKKAVVDQLKKDMGVDVAAAHLARNLLGDYGNISVAGNWIRRRLAPFWSFQEINIKRVPRLAINAWEAGGTMRAAGTLSAAAGRAILTSRIAWMYAALWIWNNLIQGGDEEEELAGYDRATPHVILGRNPDGSIRTFRRVGALGEFLEWFGINEALSMYPKLSAGQVSTSDVLREMAFATPEKSINSMRPDLKALFEVSTGTSLFPEPFQPRSQRRGELLAAPFGLEDEFRWMRGWVLGDGGTARPHYWQRMVMGIVDPRQAALSEMYDLRNEFLKKKGQTQQGIFPVSRYKEARDAATAENYDAFTDWKRRYVEERGKSAKDDFKDWLRTLDPIANRLNDTDEIEFEQKFLTSEQRGRLAVARNYSHEMRDLLVTWWDADVKSTEMKTAGAFSAFARMKVTPPKQKKYSSQEEYQSALSVYERAGESVKRDILSMAASREEAIRLLQEYYRRTDKDGKKGSIYAKGTNRFKPSYSLRARRIKEMYGDGQ
jgi:hypothetical protein